MTAKKTGSRNGKLKLRKETVRDLDARGKGRKVRGGGATAAAGSCAFNQCFAGPTQGCATAAYTNCNVSCVAVCGGVFKP